MSEMEGEGVTRVWGMESCLKFTKQTCTSFSLAYSGLHFLGAGGGGSWSLASFLICDVRALVLPGSAAFHPMNSA